MPLLQLTDITVRYGDFAALDGVSASVRAGAAVALLGENGAGKSTLSKVAYGMCRPDRGELTWDGRRVHLNDPAAARAIGIGMVHQHFTLVPAMTVAENLALAAPAHSSVAPRKMREAARNMMDRMGLPVDPDAIAGRLPVGLQQRVEILKALSIPTRLLILDEPTAVLAPKEVEDLFRVLARLRDEGASLILITHKLPEALAIADDVIVLRRGKVELAATRGEVNEGVLSSAMIGRALFAPQPLDPAAPGDMVMETGAAGLGGIRAGETVGVAGVEGNGQTELAETVVGLRPDFAVRLSENGRLVDASRWPVARRLGWGMAHIPDDRHAVALALTMSVSENLFLSGDRLPHHGPWVDAPRMRAEVARMIAEYDIRTPSAEMAVGGVSGGNQQKVVVARELGRRPRLLVAVNPTRGLDVSATEFVHNALRDHRARGGATLLISSELDELLTLSDRIAVMYDRRIVGSLSPGSTADDRDVLGGMMLGRSSGAPPSGAAQ
ncbi:MAG TPA: ABC transporter ATP-binding protein [Armatimonadota bacterium]